jgi:S-disulfanyl-L-cysteine oxidoreductase SoxD
MRDRRPVAAMRWTTGVLACMLVPFANVVAQSAKAPAKGTAAMPPPPKLSSSALKANASLASTLTGVYTDEQAGRGRNFYLGMCKSCHAPESHTGPTFAKWWKGRKLSDLFTFISTQMPKNDPGSLDSGDIADVMAYILKLNAQPPGKDELYPDADSLKKFRIDVKQAGTSTAKGKKP